MSQTHPYIMNIIINNIKMLSIVENPLDPLKRVQKVERRNKKKKGLISSSFDSQIQQGRSELEIFCSSRSFKQIFSFFFLLHSIPSIENLFILQSTPFPFRSLHPISLCYNNSSNVAFFFVSLTPESFVTRENWILTTAMSLGSLKLHAI